MWIFLRFIFLLQLIRSVINLRTVEHCTFPSAYSTSQTSFDIELFHRTLVVVCNSTAKDDNEAICNTV